MSIVEDLVTTLAISSAGTFNAVVDNDSLSRGPGATWGTGGTVSTDAGSLVGVAGQPDSPTFDSLAGSIAQVTAVAIQPQGSGFQTIAAGSGGEIELDLAGDPAALVVTAGGGLQSLTVLASFTSSAMALAEAAAGEVRRGISLF